MFGTQNRPLLHRVKWLHSKTDVRAIVVDVEDDGHPLPEVTQTALGTPRATLGDTSMHGRNSIAHIGSMFRTLVQKATKPKKAVDFGSLLD
jgi:hypothetical protein